MSTTPASLPRGLPCSSSAILSLLAGRKTQLRVPAAAVGLDVAHCPYGQVGDRLNVLEDHWLDLRNPIGKPQELIYAATPECARDHIGAQVLLMDSLPGAFRPAYTTRLEAQRRVSTHPYWRRHAAADMPAWGARIQLTLTGVRLEQLQAISPADAIAEGISHLAGRCWQRPFEDSRGRWHIGATGNPVLAFSGEWVREHGQASWDHNPWVWALSFEVQAPDLAQYAARKSA